MLDKTLVHDVLEAALSTGGDFAELFVEENAKNSINMVNGVVEKAQAGIDYGAGIRIFNGFNAIYTYTNDTSREHLIKTAKIAAGAIDKQGRVVARPLLEAAAIEGIHVCKIPPGMVRKSQIVAMLREAHKGASGLSPLITQTAMIYMDSTQNVLIANSDGLWAEDKRIRTEAGIVVVASNESEKQEAFFHPGRLCGFEFYDRINFAELGKNTANIALTMLSAGLCPGGKMPVVIDNGFGGVILHEACVHGLEATSVAKKASVFADKLGQKIASDIVTAIDDGTMPNEWGSLTIDDEGTKTQRNVLIENGVLKTFLIDRLNGLKMGMSSTGSARRESYRFAPTSRMTNTFFVNGNDKQEDIIADTEYGLYAKKMGGGSVMPGTGEFNFAVTEAYLIRDGKIAEPVRGATLIGKGNEVLMNIDRISNNFAMEQGFCGSESGSVPTNVGQPMIRVKELIVGGEADV
ncbi:MAG: TldD/PmbA family protein [Treponema sp.]|jgi:TldD protein|nr:TldD/PmbA family protein [Treponema sp.]